MSKIKVDYNRRLELFEFYWECNNCNSKFMGGITEEDISVGDTKVICNKCKKEYFIDVENLMEQFNNKEDTNDN